MKLSNLKAIAESSPPRVLPLRPMPDNWNEILTIDGNDEFNLQSWIDFWFPDYDGDGIVDYIDDEPWFNPHGKPPRPDIPGMHPDMVDIIHDGMIEDWLDDRTPDPFDVPTPLPTEPPEGITPTPFIPGRHPSEVPQTTPYPIIPTWHLPDFGGGVMA